jgi:hypothetical protein
LVPAAYGERSIIILHYILCAPQNQTLNLDELLKLINDIEKKRPTANGGA